MGNIIVTDAAGRPTKRSPLREKNKNDANPYHRRHIFWFYIPLISKIGQRSRTRSELVNLFIQYIICFAIHTLSYVETVRLLYKTKNKIKSIDITPSKIIAVGLNYRDHAKELKMRLPKEPIIFIKPPSSIIGHQDYIIYPRGVKRLDFEAELAVVVKKEAKEIKEFQAHEYILGYTCFNDVTARDLQRRDMQWTRSKSFDTFSPMGPYITKDIDPLNVGIRLYKNGILKQASNTRELIFSPYKLLAFISQIMLLLPGDIIATGTPKGVGPMKAGDIVEVVIDGIGVLRNRVKLYD